ncbi:unnamed protein product [Pleuronectes platessa]|uniref:Uncharacterized protein n=1 Tax=Pleuronectes platessa TaxID=8262 RepID=A0A9N7UBK2_PLEPL|nr:unnamed protein product [Pleuronectes platessa]
MRERLSSACQAEASEPVQPRRRLVGFKQHHTAKCPPSDSVTVEDSFPCSGVRARCLFAALGIPSPEGDRAAEQGREGEERERRGSTEKEERDTSRGINKDNTTRETGLLLIDAGCRKKARGRTVGERRGREVVQYFNILCALVLSVVSASTTDAGVAADVSASVAVPASASQSIAGVREREKAPRDEMRGCGCEGGGVAGDTGPRGTDPPSVLRLKSKGGEEEGDAWLSVRSSQVKPSSPCSSSSSSRVFV